MEELLIVKLLGKNIGWRHLKARLTKLSLSCSGMEVLELDNDFCLVCFTDWDDVVWILNTRPWMILGHCLIVLRWHLCFHPHKNELHKVIVWVRIPGLSLEFYDHNILRKIGNNLGRTIRIDHNTLHKAEGGDEGSYTTKRIRFARISIEVDLAKTLGNSTSFS